MNAPLTKAALAHYGEMAQQAAVPAWHELPIARRILRDIGSEPETRPASVRHFKAYPLTREEWVAYDRDDMRVARLDAICGAYFEVVEAVCGTAVAGAGVSLTVDEAIDAVCREYLDGRGL